MSQTEVQLIKAAAVVTADIADQAVSLDKLPHGTSSNNGKFLRANNGADPTFETVSTDLVGDTSPQLGGALDTNGNNINFGDSTGGGADDRLVFGAGSDLNIYSDGTNARIEGDNLQFKNAAGDEFLAKMTNGGSVELFHNNIKQLSTRSDGIEVHAPEGGEAMLYLTADEGDDDNDKYRLVAQNGGDLVFQRHNGSAYSSELRLKSAGGIQANFQGNNKFETTSTGVTVTGKVTATSLSCDDNTDHSMDSNPSGQVIIGGNGYTSAIALDGSNMNIYHNSSQRGIQFGINETAVARFDTSGHFVPSATNTRDLGSTSLRWRNVYTNDLNLSNEGSSNDVDGTWGSFTIQEGVEDLFLINKRNGKRYKFNLTEVS